MIQSAAELMRSQGVEGTSFSAVLDHSGAPRGSIYHHFPGGKTQLVREATEYAGGYIGQALATYADDPPAGVRAFVAMWIAALEASDFRDGCPVVAAAVADVPEAGDAFAAWEAALGGDERATLIVAAIEGAIVLCRAQQSTAPLRRVGAQLELIV